MSVVSSFIWSIFHRDKITWYGNIHYIVRVHYRQNSEVVIARMHLRKGTSSAIISFVKDVRFQSIAKHHLPIGQPASSFPSFFTIPLLLFLVCWRNALKSPGQGLSIINCAFFVWMSEWSIKLYSYMGSAITEYNQIPFTLCTMT